MNQQELIESVPQYHIGHDGFVRLVDVMGNDSSIVQAARVSYGEGTKTVQDDRGLIRYLMRHWHTTPFEMCEIKLHIRIPMDAWRQMVRHRTANINEYSTRYSEAIDSRDITYPEDWRLQSSNNKQGSGEYLADVLAVEAIENTSDEFKANLRYDHTNLPARDQHVLNTLSLTAEEAYKALLACDLSKLEEQNHINTTDAYKKALALGVAREQARKNLPLSTYTEAYWKVDLHNLFHFLRLRLDLHAQKEIRDFGIAIAEIVKLWVPIAWEAFEDYRLNAVQFSAQEMNVIRDLLTHKFRLEQYKVTGSLSLPEEQALLSQGYFFSHNQRPNSFGGPDPVYLKQHTLLTVNDEERIAYLISHGLTNKRERIEFIRKLKNG